MRGKGTRNRFFFKITKESLTKNYSHQIDTYSSRCFPSTPTILKLCEVLIGNEVLMAKYFVCHVLAVPFITTVNFVMLLLYDILCFPCEQELILLHDCSV
jgi:hypothetical protein